MSAAADLLADLFGRVAEQLPGLLDDLSPDDLAWRPAPDANPIGWLVWHLTRVQDDHLAGLAEQTLGRSATQLWDEGWRERFDLPYEAHAHGYGMSSEDVARFRGDAVTLSAYHAAVHARTLDILAALDEAGMADRLAVVVDDSYDPPVTAGVRLASVVNDTTQHIGQASYVKGLLPRR